MMRATRLQGVSFKCGTQLVAFWSYLYIQTSAEHLCHSAATSVFVEEFLFQIFEVLARLTEAKYRTFQTVSRNSQKIHNKEGKNISKSHFLRKFI